MTMTKTTYRTANHKSIDNSQFTIDNSQFIIHN